MISPSMKRFGNDADHARQNILFSLILGLWPPGYFASLSLNRYHMNISKINPLNYYVLALSEKKYELGKAT